MLPLSVLHDMVIHARAGDDVYLHALFEMFRPLLRGAAKRYARVAGYDEAYQEACAAFLHAIATHRPDSAPFPAYAASRVYGDTRTAMRKMWLAQERTAFAKASDEEGNEDWDQQLKRQGPGNPPGEDPFDRVDQRLTLLCLAREAKLSPREAAWLTMELAGLETNQLAERLGVSPATIRTWRMRAVHKMRQQALSAGLSPNDL
ncbi:sigma-70 family RNA polymerase sigma factor [Alicyclobacillus mali (ex Roth et al. 2021)]|uniref:sigma-70 family RNA polymerase sigma factor n=1 Tax=Alicyclobacillus mali (ex Roth et al. 2021) TaxID=1123961 RepID=UPI001A8EBFA5|nr:sigma-70 family RNA polymerase sigma factor [Alicyclobacillus mali (ex Roth et al. 2021)]